MQGDFFYQEGAVIHFYMTTVFIRTISAAIQLLIKNS